MVIPENTTELISSSPDTTAVSIKNLRYRIRSLVSFQFAPKNANPIQKRKITTE